MKIKQKRHRRNAVTAIDLNVLNLESHHLCALSKDQALQLEGGKTSSVLTGITALAYVMAVLSAPCLLYSTLQLKKGLRYQNAAGIAEGLDSVNAPFGANRLPANWIAKATDSKKFVELYYNSNMHAREIIKIELRKGIEDHYKASKRSFNGWLAATGIAVVGTIAERENAEIEATAGAKSSEIGMLKA